MKHATNQADVENAEAQLTNVEMITKLMEFSRFGAMAQLFVIDSVLKVARRVANQSPESLAEQWKDNPVNLEAWQGVAREIFEKLDTRNGITGTTNVEVITEIMGFSRFGPLAQVFVMDGLYKVARKMADVPPEEFESETWKNSMVSPVAWQGTAREIVEKLDVHFGN